MKSTSRIGSTRILIDNQKTYKYDLHNVPNHCQHQNSNKLAKMCVTSVHANNYIAYLYVFEMLYKHISQIVLVLFLGLINYIYNSNNVLHVRKQRYLFNIENINTTMILKILKYIFYVLCIFSIYILCIYSMIQLTPPSAPTYPNVGCVGARGYASQNVN